MSNYKRARAPNFSPDETTLLLSLAYEKRTILENKSNGAATNRQKMRAWEDIADKFNSHCPGGIFRTPASLQHLYTNRKKKMRREAASNTAKTGGSSSCSSNEDHFELILTSMNKSGQEVVENDPLVDTSIKKCPEDEPSKAILDRGDIKTDQMEIEDFDVLETQIKLEEPVPSTSNTTDSVNGNEVSSSNPKRLKSQTSPSQRTRMKSSRVSSVRSNLEQRKCELVELQISAHKRDEVRKEVEFQLRKELLELEIKVKKEELRKLQSTI